MNETTEKNAHSNAHTGKKAGLIAAGVAICLVVAVVAAGYVALYAQPDGEFRRAQEMCADGDFTGAQAVYEAMAEKKLLGVTLSSLPLGRYREAPELALENRYLEAESLLGRGKYERASEAFASLGAYRDAADRVNEPFYAQGQALEAGENYADAAAAYERADGYADAAQAAAYCRAKDALSQDKHADAETFLAQAGAYRDAEELLAQNAQAAQDERDTEARKAPYRERGHVIEWGSWEQDSDEANGREPIRWRTLDAKGDQLLLISEQVLDCVPYHSFIVITWDRCELRAWLNGTFLWDAFSEEERAALLSQPLDTDAYTSYFGVRENPNEGDLVSLLPSALTVTYFPEDAEKIAAGTAYAVSKGLTQEGEGARWWLRMDGYDGDDAAVIEPNGKKNFSVRVDSRDIGVRPVIWVDLNAVVR